ncbi:MAG TPA: hypothetical protein VFU99_11015 [Gaiellaceae bacterium]|nr:hypothetical protein [Gaiellaceae bacterium]
MRRNWFIAAIVIGVAAIVVAAVVMRITEDEPPTTAEWAEAVCADLGEWRDTVTGLADVSGETLTSELLRERIDEADSATSTLIADLRDLGAPDLESGDELEAELDEQMGALESSYDELKESAEAAADAGQGELLQELAGLATQFSAFLTQLDSTVDTLENANVAEESRAELEQAFADAPSCQSLQADS